MNWSQLGSMAERWDVDGLKLDHFRIQWDWPTHFAIANRKWKISHSRNICDGTCSTHILEEFLREICNSHSNKWGKWHTHIHWRRRNNVSMNNGGDDLNGIWRAVVWRKEMAWDFCEWKREIEINEINSIESIE